MKKFICAITGTNGYLGSKIQNFLEKNGCKVFSLNRRDKRNPFILGETNIDKKWFSDNKIEVLIHCAYDFSVIDWNCIHTRNVVGSISLLNTAAESGVKKLIFISSMSAYEGCHSLYGQAKLEVEKKVLELKGWVLRPGLIVGKQAAGIVGSMQKLIKLTPIIPLIGSGNQILYLSHENDLIASIYQTVKSSEEAPFFSITTANATPRTFKEILIMLAQQHGRSPILIPLPWRAVWFLFKIMEIFKFSLSFRSDSIISLMYQNPSPDFSKEIVFFRDCKKL